LSNTQPLGNLSTYVARDWIDKESLTRTKLQFEFDQIDALIDQIKNSMTDMENHRAGGSAPTSNKIRGQLWADTSNTDRVVLKLDPDESGADDEFATRIEAKQISYASGGSATHKVMGAINVDVTTVTVGPSSGTLITYTLPADSLDTNGKLVRISCWGTANNSSSSAQFSIRFNTGTQHTFTIDTSTSTDWHIKWFIVRTAATTQDWHAHFNQNRDDTGITDLVNSGTDAETLANALAIDVFSQAMSGGDTVTMDGMIVELLN